MFVIFRFEEESRMLGCRKCRSLLSRRQQVLMKASERCAGMRSSVMVEDRATGARRERCLWTGKGKEGSRARCRFLLCSASLTLLSGVWFQRGD